MWLIKLGLETLASFITSDFQDADQPESFYVHGKPAV